MTDYPLFIVLIQDKELDGEPDIGACVVEAVDEEDAIRKSNAVARCEALARDDGRGRCVPHARRLPLNLWWKTSAVIRGARSPWE